MPVPYVGEIRMFAGVRLPAEWAVCDGSLLLVKQYPALFDLIRTRYGGDGVQTFALPDLRGRVPVHVSEAFRLGLSGGEERVALDAAQMPAHDHDLIAASVPGSTSAPVGAMASAVSTSMTYIDAEPTVAMADTAIGSAGRGRPHGNIQPYLCINFIISLAGLFPARA